MKAAREVGWYRLLRFGIMTLTIVPYRLALFPPVARCCSACTARISRRVVLHDVRFVNLYRRGLAGLRIGDECFLGESACSTWPMASTARRR